MQYVLQCVGCQAAPRRRASLSCGPARTAAVAAAAAAAVHSISDSVRADLAARGKPGLCCTRKLLTASLLLTAADRDLRLWVPPRIPEYLFGTFRVQCKSVLFFLSCHVIDITQHYQH
jgi:hypothetical protein